MAPQLTQSEINGKKIAGLEAHMEYIAETLKEVKSDVKALVKHNEEIALIKEHQHNQDITINALSNDVDHLKVDINDVKQHTNKILWILGAVYSMIIFFVVTFADELKQLIFHR